MIKLALFIKVSACLILAADHTFVKLTPSKQMSSIVATGHPGQYGTHACQIKTSCCFVWIEAQISKASMGVCMYIKVKPKTIHVVACNAKIR